MAKSNTFHGKQISNRISRKPSEIVPTGELVSMREIKARRSGMKGGIAIAVSHEDIKQQWVRKTGPVLQKFDRHR